MTFLLALAANGTSTARASSQPLQCNNLDNCRALPTIVYSCLATAFLCTWIAFHMNVPKIQTPFRRFRLMLGALIAPEIVFGFAYCHWIESCAMLKDIKERYPKCNWTETHAQFARMGGFRLRYPDGVKEPIDCRNLLDLVNDGTIDLPDITREDIQIRCKGDPIATGIAIIQTTWFVIQCIYRGSQGLYITAIEFITLGYAAINFLIYWCWWYKPQRVCAPIDIPSKKLRLDVKLTSEKARSEEDVVARFFKSDAGDYRDDIKEALSDVLTFMSRKGDGRRPPSVTELGEIQRRSSFDSIRTSEAHTVVAASSAGHSRIDSKPVPGTRTDVEAIQILSPQSIRLRLGIMLNSANHTKGLSSHRRILFLIAFFIVGSSFGLIHCLAWNSQFPTSTERHMWEAMALVVTIIGGAMMVLAGSADENDFWGNTKKPGPYIILIVIFIYSFARILLLILALIQLRALPYSAYVSPSWSLYYPHIS